MVKIGWLADQVGLMGGAELSGQALVKYAPDWAEIVFCPEQHRPPEDIELWMLQNVVTYGERWIDPLANGAPIIKHFRDPWHPGDPWFRRYVLTNAELMIYNSQLSRVKCPWDHGARAALVPPPVDLAAFRAARRPPEERHGNIYVGRLDYAKGLHRAIDWAIRHGVTLDVYGEGMLRGLGEEQGVARYYGQRPYAEMPQIFGRAKRYVLLPGAIESYSRTTVEAWAAGCELVADGARVGALEWLNVPEKIEFKAAIERFWTVVKEVADAR